MFLGWILAEGITDEVRFKRVKRLQLIFTDLLCVLPASSAAIERQHANVQVDSNGKKVGRIAS